VTAGSPVHVGGLPQSAFAGPISTTLTHSMAGESIVAARLVDASDRPVRLSKREDAFLLASLGAPERPLAREHLVRAMRVDGEFSIAASVIFSCSR
jgi:hypothetical protein